MSGRDNFRCVVYGCKYQHGIRSFSFPTNSIIRNKWIDFAKKTSGGDHFSEDSITKKSKVCSTHFLSTDYNQSQVQQCKMGLLSEEKVHLHREAYPSIPAKV
ncbi:unnamed protein product, partial [Meganyctiphanes norvegica]